MQQEIKNWLEQARADFKTAQDCLTANNYYASVSFSQQCAEKSLKALYIQKKNTFPPRLHDLVELVRLVGATKIVMRKAQALTITYLSSRYPGAGLDIPARYYTVTKAKRHLKEAEVILKWIEKKIKL